MTTTMYRFLAWLQVRYADARAGADRGEIVEKVIIVAATAAIAIAAMAAIAAAVNLKVAGIRL